MATAIGTGISRAGGAAGRASRNLMLGYMVYFFVLGLIFLFLLLVYIFIAAIGLQLGIEFTCELTGCISAWDTVVGIDFIGLIDRLMAGILFFIAAPVGIIVFLLSVLLNPIGEIAFIFINILFDIVNAFTRQIFFFEDIFPIPLDWDGIDTSAWMADFGSLVETLKGIILFPVEEGLGIRAT